MIRRCVLPVDKGLLQLIQTDIAKRDSDNRDSTVRVLIDLGRWTTDKMKVGRGASGYKRGSCYTQIKMKCSRWGQCTHTEVGER